MTDVRCKDIITRQHNGVRERERERERERKRPIKPKRKRIGTEGVRLMQVSFYVVVLDLNELGEAYPYPPR